MNKKQLAGLYVLGDSFLDSRWLGIGALVFEPRPSRSERARTVLAFAGLGLAFMVAVVATARVAPWLFPLAPLGIVALGMAGTGFINFGRLRFHETGLAGQFQGAGLGRWKRSTRIIPYEHVREATLRDGRLRIATRDPKTLKTGETFAWVPPSRRSQVTQLLPLITREPRKLTAADAPEEFPHAYAPAEPHPRQRQGW